MQVKSNNRLKLILIICSALLLVPLIAMQYTDEVNWNIFDFIVAAILLFGTGLLLNFILIKYKKRKQLILISLLVVFFLLWAELAVGIFGTFISGS